MATPARKHTVTPGWERSRREVQERLYLCLQGDVRREEPGELTGGKGDLIMDEVRRVLAGIRFNTAKGKWEAHALVANMIDLSVDIQREVTEELALNKKAPIEVLGTTAASPAFAIARERTGFDLALLRASRFAQAIGAGVIYPTLHPSFPPGIVAVPPSRVVVFVSPTNPMEPIAAIVFLGHAEYGQILFWSVMDPNNPRFEHWTSASKWAYAEQYPNGLNQSGLINAQNGAAYPWTWGPARRPLLPIAGWQGPPDADTFLPVHSDLLLGTLDTIIERTRAKMHGHVSAPNRLILLSDEPLAGLDGASTNYASIINAHGKNASNAKAQIQPEGTEASARLLAACDARVSRWLSKINKGLRLREEKGAQSGIAIALEMTNLWNWWKQQCTAGKRADIHAVRILVSTWNYAIRAGYWYAEPIPEVDDIEIEHVPMWTPEQQRRILEDIWKAIEIGAATEVDYYLALHGRSQAHRKDAEAQLIELRREKARIQQASDIYEVRLNRAELDAMGRGGVSSAIQFIELERDKSVGTALKALVDATAPVDPRGYMQLRAPDIPMLSEVPTDGQTWTAPRDVAGEASAGAALFNRFNKPGTPAADRRGSPAAKRMADKIRRGRPLDRGDLIDIVTFTDQAEKDGAGQPGWNDDASPSTQWIDFRCYGGDPGRTWANTELDKQDGIPGGNAEPIEDEPGDSPTPSPAASRYRPGDRVQVKGEPHMDGQDKGTVDQSVETEVLSIVFDGTSEPHKWYTADEVTPIEDGAEV